MLPDGDKISRTMDRAASLLFDVNHRHSGSRLAGGDR
jgi:hypothetical protein